MALRSRVQGLRGFQVHRALPPQCNDQCQIGVRLSMRKEAHCLSLMEKLEELSDE